MILSFLFTLFLDARLNDIITHIEELRLLNFKAYPYLYVRTHQVSSRQSSIYKNNTQAIVVEATKVDKVQAHVMGTPVSRFVSDFPDIELVLKQAHFDPQKFYYFEEALMSDDMELMEKMYSLVEKHDFYAIKDIKAGDEIVMDYNELNEPEQLKEDYFRK